MKTFHRSRYPGQTTTVVCDRILKNTTKYLVQYYDRIFSCRLRRYTTTYGERYGRLRSSNTEFVYDLRFAPYFPVNNSIPSYTTRRNMIVILNHVLRDRTVGYGACIRVYGRKREYMHCVSLDLGNYLREKKQIQ